MQKSIFSFLLLLGFCACSGQVEDLTPNAASTILHNTVLKKRPGTTKYDNVRCGIADRNGNLWFGTTSQGLYKFDGKSFLNYTIETGLPSDVVNCVMEARDGNIWIGTTKGAAYFDGRKFIHVPVRVGTNSFYGNVPGNNSVTRIMQDVEGKIWFGTIEGIFIYNQGNVSAFLSNRSVQNDEHLHLRSVGALLQDKKGNVWFGSDAGEGVVFFNGRSLSSLKPNVFKTVHGHVRVTDILQDKAGQIWFGTAAGAYCYDGTTLKNVTKEAGYEIWAFTLFERMSGDIIVALTVPDGIHQYLLAITAKGDVQKIPIEKSIADTEVFCIVEDKKGNIWLGTRNLGLYKFNGKSVACYSQ